MTLRPGRRAILLSAVLLAMAALLWFSKYRSRARETALLEHRLEQLERRNEEARGLTPAGATQLSRHLDTQAAHIARLERLIPRSEEVPALLEALAAEARRSGLGDLAFIRPGAVEPGPFYARQSYEMSVAGGYHDVARFLTALASLPRIVTPVELEMTAAPGLGPGDDTGVSVHFRIETYLRPAAGADAPIAANPGPPSEIVP